VRLTAGWRAASPWQGRVLGDVTPPRTSSLRHPHMSRDPSLGKLAEGASTHPLGVAGSNPALRSCPSLCAQHADAAPGPPGAASLVSLSPAIAGTLRALGAGAQLAGVPADASAADSAAAPDAVISFLPPSALAQPAATDQLEMTQATQQPPQRGPLRLLGRLVQRVAPGASRRARGPWQQTAARVAERTSDWQPLHELHLEALQRLTSPIILTWEPEDEAKGPVLPANEPCHIGTLDQVGHADLDADLVTVPAPRSIAGVCDAIAAIGAVAGRDAAAAALLSSMRADMRSIAQRCRGGAARPRPRVLALRSLCPLRLAGGWLPALVDLAGGELVAIDPGDGSCTLLWTDVQSLQPDIVLLLVDGVPLDAALPEVGPLADQPGWWTLPAVVENAVYVASIDDVLSAGPGMVRALCALAAAMHPDVALRELTATMSTADRVPAYQLAMKPRQRCRAAFLPSFFAAVEL
jgi:ABC-type hemin transport system substrate-binding protein